ncbi:MAG: cytochrome c oxidase subunit II [Proteobacteria bacterium]|nr:cytochrome c oxidase subunit II [Pseudomonadota bacterium]
MSVRKSASALAASVATTFVLAGAATAADLGVSREWQMVFQDPATPVMENIVGFHNLMLVLITAISAFVLALLLYIMWRFNSKSNPVPSKNTHNTTLEVIWTVIPIIILVVMAIPSLRLLYEQDVVPTPELVQERYGIQVDGEMTIKATAFQWAWMYDYPDHGVQGMDAFCAAGPTTYCLAEAGPGDQRLLETSNRVVVPVNTLVRLQVTSQDVIHAWAMPAFGVKLDAVPGRILETWFVATREGSFFGQCSELCGVYHGFMPIAVDVVSRAEFETRIAELAAMYPAF